MSGASSSRDWLRVATLLFCAGWGANQFVALLPIYRETIPLSGEDAAAVFGVYAVTIVPSLIVSGPLSDRLGRRRVTLAAAAIALLGNAVLSSAGASFGGLLTGRALVGLGSGATFNAGSTWLVDLDPVKSAPRATASMAGGFGLGPLFAGVVSTLAPLPLIAPYIAQMVALAVAMMLLPPRDAVHAHTERATSTEPIGAPRFVRRVVLVAPWVFVFPSLAFVVVPSLFPANRTLPIFVGAMAASALFTGVVAARAATRAESNDVTVGLIGGGIGVAIAAVAARWGLRPLAIAAGIPLGVGYGWTMARTFRLVATRARPRWRATLVGVTYALSYAGFAAPRLFVRLARSLGPTAALALIGLFALASAVAAFELPSARST